MNSSIKKTVYDLTVQIAAMQDLMPDATATAIGSAIGVGQSYANRMLDVANNCTPRVLREWSVNQNGLSLEIMLEISRLTPRKQLGAIKAEIRREKSRGPSSWIPITEKRVEQLAVAVALLYKSEQVDVEFIEKLGEIGLIKIGANKNDLVLSDLVKKFERAFRKAMK